MLLYTISPNSFNLGPQKSFEESVVVAVYFSFVTITTLGYGDIIPISPIARMLSVMEALIGQLYLIVMVARLVALNCTQSKEN